MAGSSIADCLSVGRLFRQLIDAPVYVSLQAVLLQLVGEFSLGKWAKMGQRAVAKDDVHLQDVIGRHSIEDGVTSRGVIRYDASQTGAVAARGVGPKLESVRS